MLDVLSSGFKRATSRLRGYSKITEKNIQESLEEVRTSLLEADVEYSVAKNFLARVKENSIGKQVKLSAGKGAKNIRVTAADHFIDICKQELQSLMGPVDTSLAEAKNGILTIMLVGLQGTGKTTTAAKLAKFLEKQNKKKVLMVSLDVYRPAAQEQLNVLGQKNSIQTLPIVKDQLPNDIVKRALNAASLSGTDVIIFDTAGRTQIDLSMMTELKEIKSLANPLETILVADSLTGQVAVNVALEFKKAVDLTGIILTRLDGDGRGGAGAVVRALGHQALKGVAQVRSRRFTVTEDLRQLRDPRVDAVEPVDQRQMRARQGAACQFDLEKRAQRRQFLDPLVAQFRRRDTTRARERERPLGREAAQVRHDVAHPHARAERRPWIIY